jgi:hypothetical protein
MADPAISLPSAGTLAPVASSGSLLARVRDAVMPDLRYDGAFVGERNGAPAAFSSASDVDAVPPIEPDATSFGASHREAAGDILFVNGIDTTWRNAYADAKALANQTGQPVVDVHVATSAFGNVGATGTVGDGIDTLASLAGAGGGKPSHTLATAILERLDRNEPVHIVAHSRGAIVTSDALRDVAAELQRRGDSPDDARAELGKVEVETFGAAERSYPDGPQYVHYVNRADPVAEVFGLARSGGHPGAGATTLAYDDNRFGFHDLDPAANHHFLTAYLSDERVPFDFARTLSPSDPDAIVRYVDDVAHRPNARPQLLN